MPIYEFAGYTLDMRQGRLRRGSQDVDLRPKSLALLVYLIKNPGRVIDKEELISVVWPEVVVSDDSLSQCLKDVRGRLGPEADGLIRTVPRRGYIVDEQRIEKRETGPKSRKPSIAVLPFRPLGNDREHQWFADGIAEDISTALARTGRLFVLPRYSRPAHREGVASTVEVARELGVRYLLEGSVRLSGVHVRVSTQLLDGDSGELLWAQRFDRQVADIFLIQDEITETTVRHLEIELLPGERNAIQLSQPDSIEAYTYYRHGRQLAQHWTKSYLLVARRMFAKAAELAPDFARAYAGMVLCDCYLLEWHATQETPDAILSMADRALALDPKLAEAHVARGFALYRTGHYDDAQLAYDRAVLVESTCYEAHLFAGHLAWVRGHRNGAVEQFSLAAELRQDDYLAPFFILGMIAKDDPRRMSWARLCLERAERAATLQPENAALLSRGAIALAHLGDPQRAISWMTRALTIDPQDLVSQYNSAGVHSLLGNKEAAMRLLEDYVQQVSPDMIDLIRHDGDFDGIRDHPRYEQLISHKAK